MSKAVMLSIRPEWCAKIIIGRKTMELRKSVPKLEVPFKCYIYCTSGHPYISVKGGNLDRDTVRTNTVGRCNGKVMLRLSRRTLLRHLQPILQTEYKSGRSLFFCFRVQRKGTKICRVSGRKP